MDQTETVAAHHLAGRVLDELLERHPEWATTLGDHRFDDRLADRRPAGSGRGAAPGPAGALADLDAVDDVALTPPERVDLEMLRNALAERRSSSSELRPHELGPAGRQPRHGDLHRCSPATSRRSATGCGRSPAGSPRSRTRSRTPGRRSGRCRGCTSRPRSASSPARRRCSRDRAASAARRGAVAARPRSSPAGDRRASPRWTSTSTGCGRPARRRRRPRPAARAEPFAGKLALAHPRHRDSTPTRCSPVPRPTSTGSRREIARDRRAPRSAARPTTRPGTPGARPARRRRHVDDATIVGLCRGGAGRRRPPSSARTTW